MCETLGTGLKRVGSASHVSLDSIVCEDCAKPQTKLNNNRLIEKKVFIIFVFLDTPNGGKRLSKYVVKFNIVL